MTPETKALLERIEAMPTPSDYPLIAAILTDAAAEIKRLQAELKSREAMQAAIDYAQGEI